MAKISYLQAVNQAMSEEMRRDETVIFLGEDIGLYGGCFGVSRGMFDEFGPERVVDTPITETGFTAAAMGLALLGFRPIVEMMFGDFVTLAADPIINHAAKYRFMTAGQVEVPLIMRLPFGSGTGAAAQHSQTLESVFLNTPGLYVVAPATPYDAKGLIKAAIRDNNPVIVCENKLLYRTNGEVPDEDYTVEIGKADVKKEGKDITIVTWSRMLIDSLEAAEKLEKEGISVEVVDLRSLRPLDIDTIAKSVIKTSKALVVYEAPQFGGFGGEVVAQINESEAFYHLDAPVKRLGGEELPVPYNPVLEKQIVPTCDTIIAKVKEMI